METKFTPGPWQAEIATMHGKVIEYFVRVDGDEIAIASAICDRDGQPNQANARLIAAAPDLYALVEEIVRDGLGSSWKPRAEAALKRARGEQ